MVETTDSQIIVALLRASPLGLLESRWNVEAAGVDCGGIVGRVMDVDVDVVGIGGATDWATRACSLLCGFRGRIVGVGRWLYLTLPGIFAVGGRWLVPNRSKIEVYGVYLTSVQNCRG